MQIDLPYFDIILSQFEADPIFAHTFGRHVHFGFWENPDDPGVYEDVHDSIIAMDRMCNRLLELADIHDQQEILDVGCGFGGTLATIDERFSRMRLTGLNIDERQLEVARRRVSARPGNQLQFVHGDACAMTFPDAAFDRVLAIECIFHFPSREAFFEHVRRVLRPGGSLTITDFIVPEGGTATFDNAEKLWGNYSLIELSSYQDLAARFGLKLTHHEDITANVRPTYWFFGNILGLHSPEAGELTRSSVLIMDLGLLTYASLRFDLID